MDAQSHRWHQKSPRSSSLVSAWTLLHVGAVYWLSIYPQVRKELSKWERHARAIPDNVLREQAVCKLTVERLNPEAAAFFAVLAPRAARRRVVQLIVAYQILYDYLDAVNEIPGGTSLRNGLQLHLALTDATLPDRPLRDYYLYNPERHDGGYVYLLARTCRRIIGSLASQASVAPLIVRATHRCAHAQSYNHALAREDEQAFIAWSCDQAPGTSYLWWELAAGGISCLAIHALFALAANPTTTFLDAQSVDRAYFPRYAQSVPSWTVSPTTTSMSGPRTTASPLGTATARKLPQGL